MYSPSTASRRPSDAEDDAEIAALLTGGGDERIALDPQSGLNLYGCGDRPWTGGLTFSSTTASPLSPAGFGSARAMLRRLQGAARSEIHEAAAGEVRDRLRALCGLSAEDGADIILAPSGTDLHRIAATCAKAGGRGPLVAVMPDAVESGRGVERAVRGLPYAASPPFARRGAQAGSDGGGEVIPIALRSATGLARPAADIDTDVEAACARAARAGCNILLVLLDVSKTGLSAPSPACAAGLKARYGERLTVLVDACQFRLAPETLRAHLDRDFLVAVTGSKFLAGPPFSGALLAPPGAAERLRTAPLAWRELECSAREDWPETYAGRALLPAAFSLGPALRWSAALDHFTALQALPQGTLSVFVEDFGAALAARLGEQPSSFEAVSPARPARGEPAGWDDRPTIFPLLLKRNGEPLAADAVAALFARLQELARRRNAGQLWIGQPVTIGVAHGHPLSAVRLALGAPHLIAHAGTPDGCGQLMALADECLWEIERLIGST